MRRDAAVKGRDEIRAIANDQQVNDLFTKLINEAAGAGLGWLILGQFGKKQFPKGEDLARENFQQVKQQADDWLVRLVARIVGCEIRRS